MSAPDKVLEDTKYVDQYFKSNVAKQIPDEERSDIKLEESRRIRIITINARSLRPTLKQHTLKRLVADFDPHFVVITETWWNTDTELKIAPGYAVIQSKPCESRGVMIYYKQIFELKLRTRFADHRIIACFAQEHFEMTLVAAYVPPMDKTIQESLVDFVNNHQMAPGGYLVVTGDFNDAIAELD